MWRTWRKSSWARPTANLRRAARSKRSGCRGSIKIDPDMIQDASPALAAHVADVAQIELGKTYGEFAQGSAVEAIRVPGVDHVTIVYSAAAATTIVRWLDSTFGITRTGAIEVADGRLGATGLALLVFVIALVPMGRGCGSMGAGWGVVRRGRARARGRADGSDC